ncbi:LOW QUALITY PROTEIN: kunitz type trypsin inhibitor 111 [Jatropha curcas]|uniref:LOW QUALITY PROTEIN: kunitz type trypsin inhibitor 111 n=1 Tax=Jatropha curcas TaxID=180498 RepID=UPI0018950518|nr:LOW QUALITY PROTEIN: kunitz type trypsin inhibitor 111 [Jatropha curcas]
MFRFIGSFTFLWLVMATTAMAQSTTILDTNGQPLTSGVEYYVLPAATDTAGGLTLVNRTGSCPFYVGQEPLSTVNCSISQGLPVGFTPMMENSVCKRGYSFTVSFSASTTCVRSTGWRLDNDEEVSRTFIVTGGDQSFFRIQIDDNGLYNLIWCPVCDRPNCPRFRCLDASIFLENGKRLLIVGEDQAFPFRFRRAN